MIDYQPLFRAVEIKPMSVPSTRHKFWFLKYTHSFHTLSHNIEIEDLLEKIQISMQGGMEESVLLRDSWSHFTFSPFLQSTKLFERGT